MSRRGERVRFWEEINQMGNLGENGLFIPQVFGKL